MGVFALCRTNGQQTRLLGTAFSISENKLATTAHSVMPNDDGLGIVIPFNDQLLTYQDTCDLSIRVLKVSICDIDTLFDIAILSLDEAVLINKYVLTSSDDAPVGSPISTLGFPHSDQGRMVLTEQQTSVGARILLGNDKGVKTKHLVLNTQARPGQSGGPVFRSGTNNVVAMLVGSYAPGGGGGISLGGVDPATLHQTTHAISAEYVRAYQ